MPTQRVDHEIAFRDLRSLLTKKLGDDLIIVKSKAKPLLSPGENYGSTMFQVDAIIRKSADAPEEDLHLVAKMLPATDVQRAMFESPVTFKKEVFLYEDLIPSYKRFQTESGIPGMEAFDIVPKFFGSRLSLKPEVNEVDDDAAILMENLKVKGFYMADRRIGENTVRD